MSNRQTATRQQTILMRSTLVSLATFIRDKFDPNASVSKYEPMAVECLAYLRAERSRAK